MLNLRVTHSQTILNFHQIKFVGAPASNSESFVQVLLNDSAKVNLMLQQIFLDENLKCLRVQKTENNLDLKMCSNL